MGTMEFFLWLRRHKKTQALLWLVFLSYQSVVIHMLKGKWSLVYSVMLGASLLAYLAFEVSLNGWFMDPNKPIQLEKFDELEVNPLEHVSKKDDDLFLGLWDYLTPIGKIVHKSCYYFFKLNYLLIVSAIVVLNIWLLPLILIGLFWPVYSHVALEDEMLLLEEDYDVF